MPILAGLPELLARELLQAQAEVSEKRAQATHMA